MCFQQIDACVTPVLELDEAKELGHHVERGAFAKNQQGQLDPVCNAITVILSWRLSDMYSLGCMNREPRGSLRPQRAIHATWHSPFISCLQCTLSAIRLFPRFCKMFSESSTVVIQLPCCPGKQGELSENCFQNGDKTWEPPDGGQCTVYQP